MYERIRGLREDKDLSQVAIANYLKIHQTTYSDYELGKLNIPILILIKLSHYYNTSIDYLLDQTDHPNPYERSRAKNKYFQKNRLREINLFSLSLPY